MDIFTKSVLNKNVFISRDEYILSSDQTFDTYPCRFATVSLMLENSQLLCNFADRIRENQGFRPLNAMDEYTTETCDQSGWYDFYIRLNDYNKSKVDNCITFIVVNCESADNEKSYAIDLSFEEQKVMLEQLNQECRRKYRKTCEDLLEETRK